MVRAVELKKLKRQRGQLVFLVDRKGQPCIGVDSLLIDSLVAKREEACHCERMPEEIARTFFVIPSPTGIPVALTSNQIEAINRVLGETFKNAKRIQIETLAGIEMFTFSIDLLDDEFFPLDSCDFLERIGLKAADWRLAMEIPH